MMCVGNTPASVRADPEAFILDSVSLARYRQPKIELDAICIIGYILQHGYKDYQPARPAGGTGAPSESVRSSTWDHSERLRGYGNCRGGPERHPVTTARCIACCPAQK